MVCPMHCTGHFLCSAMTVYRRYLTPCISCNGLCKSQLLGFRATGSGCRLFSFHNALKNNSMCNKKNEAPMTGQVEVFNFSQEKAPIRVQLINSEPWFVAKDVCEVLEHSNHKMAIKSLDEDEVSSVYLIDTMGRKQETKVVSESGLYSLIFQSRKAEAKKFRKWVTSEVLPSIRKKGYYGSRSSPPTI